MPAGIKPKHCVGKKGKSGRKTKREELKEVVEKAVEIATAEALTKLANRKVYKQLNQELDFVKTKEMALPITLRGIADKTENLNIDVNVEEVGEESQSILNEIINKRKKDV